MSDEKSNVRSCNSYVQLSDGSFVKIKQFLVDNKNSKEVTLCNVIETTSGSDDNIVYAVNSINPELVAIETHIIKKICLFVSVKKYSYIIAVPNLLHY